METTNNLIASVALFSELYNNEKYTNITDILGEFIKAVVVSEGKWITDVTEIANLLEKVYEFKIPDSVIKTTIKNRLKSVATFSNGSYSFDQSIRSNFAEIDKNYQQILNIQTTIISELVDFVEFTEQQPISEGDKDALIRNFNNFLLDSHTSEKFASHIGAFIIKNQNNAQFTESLNLVREGIILYQGIRYTADINEMGKWNTELKIYLNTEQLFNALGFNGLLYQEIFNDFYNLVKEINFSSRNKQQEKLIHLHFFEETYNEVLRFFHTAEKILKGEKALNSHRPAMKYILDGCKGPSDVVNKRIKFEADLKQMGITLKEFKTSVYSYQDYVVDDEKVLEELKKHNEKQERDFNIDECREYFQIFTKINYLRGGENKTKFEKIGHIFITANAFALYLAHNSKVKFFGDDIPFAKDLDFITNKFWFKLRKGFGEHNSFPKSFDVVVRAQIILSSQLNNSINQEYFKLQKQYEQGQISREEVLERSFELREKPNVPENITIETIENSLDFLTNEVYFEDIAREKAKKEIQLQDMLSKNKALEEELEVRNSVEKERLLREQLAEKENKRKMYVSDKWGKCKNQTLKDFFYFLFVELVTVLPIVIGFLLKENDTMSAWLKNMGTIQWFIWGLLIITFVIEVTGRSYIFNKDRIKRGWHSIRLIQPKKFMLYKEGNLKRFEEEFSQLHQQQ